MPPRKRCAPPPRGSLCLPTELPTADPDELGIRAERAKERMRRGGTGGPPPGAASPERTIASISRYVRNPEVVAWVLLAARGACELCDEPAPFAGSDGEPFLEVHHVRPLGEGGPDQTDNAVAVCPSCHRQLHYGSDRLPLRGALIAKIERLRDYPIRTEVEAFQLAPELEGALRPLE